LVSRKTWRLLLVGCGAKLPKTRSTAEDGHSW
jgi:hypothetical protein